MALVVESFASASSTTTSVAVTKPTGVASGDLVIGVARANNASAMSSTDFTTEVFDLDAVGGYRLALYYKIAGGSEPASYTFTGTASNNMDAAVIRVSGADTTTPFDTHGTLEDSSEADSTCNAPAITTAGDNYLVLRMATPDGAVVTCSTTPDTEIVRVEQLGVSYKIQASAGTTGTGAFTFSLIEQYNAATASFIPATAAAERRAVVSS